MPYGVTSSGFVKKTLMVIRDQILDFWKANISATVDTSEDGLEYQLASSFSEQLAEAWDAQEAEYASRDPAQAEGQALDDLLHLRGVYRRPATQSLVTATVNLDAGTYAAGDLVASVAGDPTARFANDVDVVSTGVDQDVLFRSETDGPVHANAHTLSISNSVSGWNSIDNASDAVLGLSPETDVEYYTRSEQEFGSEQSATADAVRSAVLALAGVTYARVYVNDDPTTDANGVLGNAVEAVVLGGDSAAIRSAILATKAAGIRAVGSSSGTVSDSQGNVYALNFTRPTQVQPYVWIYPVYDPNTYPGDVAVKQFVLDWADANLSVGIDVTIAALVWLVRGLPGVYDVTVKQGSTNVEGSATATNFAIAVREYADLDSTRVTVSSTSALGPA
jgi:hypothetical protein